MLEWSTHEQQGNRYSGVIYTWTTSKWVCWGDLHMNKAMGWWGDLHMNNKEMGMLGWSTHEQGNGYDGVIYTWTTRKWVYCGDLHMNKEMGILGWSTHEQRGSCHAGVIYQLYFLPLLWGKKTIPCKSYLFYKFDAKKTSNSNSSSWPHTNVQIFSFARLAVADCMTLANSQLTTIALKCPYLVTSHRGMRLLWAINIGCVILLTLHSELLWVRYEEFINITQWVIMIAL